MGVNLSRFLFLKNVLFNGFCFFLCKPSFVCLGFTQLFEDVCVQLSSLFFFWKIFSRFVLFFLFFLVFYTMSTLFFCNFAKYILHFCHLYCIFPSKSFVVLFTVCALSLSYFEASDICFLFMFILGNSPLRSWLEEVITLLHPNASLHFMQKICSTVSGSFLFLDTWKQEITFQANTWRRLAF